MFNSTKLIDSYCGNNTNSFIYNNDLNTFGACFQFTIIELPIYILSIIILSYMIGNLRPDELDRIIQNRKKKDTVFLILECISILSFIICILFDENNYYLIYKQDYNGHLNSIIKIIAFSFLAFFTFKSYKCYNYSNCRLITLNILLSLIIIIEILHFSLIKTYLRIFSLIDSRLIYCYIKLISIFIYFTLFNFSHFVNKRIHPLFYESFANYDSSFNLEMINDFNQNRKTNISKLFFNWVQPFLRAAANDQIRNESDIFHLPETLTSIHVKKQIQIMHNNLINNLENQTQSDVDNSNEHRQSFNSTNQFIDINQPITKIKLRTLLWKAYNKEFFKISNLKLIADIFSFFSPVLLNQLILYIDSTNFTANGFLLVLALLVSSLITSLSINLHDFLINNLWIKIKRKIFSLKTSSLHGQFSSGQLLNYASVDSDRVANFCTSSFQLISMPLQIIIALYLLYLQIGFSFIAGLLFSICLIILNKFISFKIASITQELLNYKDIRIKLSTKLISNIKPIKMNCWQDIYTNQINEARKKELNLLKKKKYLDAICVYFWAVSSTVISFLTFCVFVLLGNKLNAANVFTSLSLLNMMIVPLNSLFFVVAGILESNVSLNRIQEFLDLNLDDDMLKDQQEQQNDDQSENIIEFDDLIVEHKESDQHGFKFVLGPIDLKVKRGELIIITGPIGSGKTSFLNAILNEMPIKTDGLFLKSGKIRLNCGKNGIGYISQIPWIQNDTIRNNILFGKNYEYKFYQKILDDCDLRKDLETFNDYDNTIISDKGLSLSGGQKARIALARAMYQSKDFELFLIDDLISNLDVHVAAKVFENCILKFLKSKTRILCTNQLEYLKYADRIVVLDNGCVKMIDKPENILKELGKNQLSTKLSKDLNDKFDKPSYNLDPIDNGFKEELNRGKVKISIYLIYLKSIGIPLAIFIILFLIMMQSSRTTQDYWLSYWTDKLKIDADTDSMYYLKILLIIVIVNNLLAVFRSVLFAYGCVNAAQNLCEKLYQTIMHKKLSFINQRSIGQILNRINIDVYHIDENLPFTLNIFLACLVGVFASLFITIYTVPLSLVLLIILFIPYYSVQYYFRSGSMILKRFNSNLLSPIYTQLNETFVGLTTIRSFNSSKRFIRDFEEKVDMNNSANFSLKAITQWLNLRIQLIGIGLSCFIALIGCIYHYYAFTQQTSLIALGLVYSLQITGVLNSLISSFTSLEIDFISVERLAQYFDNSDKEELGMIRLINFPKNGQIRFENVSFKYKNDSNYALNSVSFNIDPGNFIGIVGRTGAGKSSIYSLLFRMYDLLDGAIYIDNQNIKLLHVNTLRKGMFIIPQDPFLFDGSIRDNLNPTKSLTDAEIWQAIDECDAKAIILKLGGLNATINEQESNLSCGEKQLICIIRALLCKVKILCLDESTSSLDHQMETNICKLIKRVFSKSTVLMISHRPSCVIGCDKILVLDAGELIEYDTPDKLICDSNSSFYKMWLVEQNKN